MLLHASPRASPYIYGCSSNSAPAMTEKFPILSRLAQTDNTQPGAMLDVLRLLLNASHVNLLAASDQTSVLHARMFQAAVRPRVVLDQFLLLLSSSLLFYYFVLLCVCNFVIF